MHELHSKWRKPKASRSQKNRTKAATEAKLKSGKDCSRVVSKPTPQATPRRKQTANPQNPGPSGSASTRPNTSISPSTSTPNLTASRRKIELFQEILPLSALTTSEENPDGDYIIMSRKCLNNMVSTFQCKVCLSNLKVCVGDRQGYAEKIVTMCEVCQQKNFEDYSSERIKCDSSKRPPFAINRAFTEAFLSMGLGHQGMLTFSSTIGMNSMSHQTFDNHLKSLEEDLKAFKKHVLEESRRTVRELYEMEDPSLKIKQLIDIVVSYDGTWMKRGFSSLYGIGFVIDISSGLVIDYEILSKYCHACTMAEKSLEQGTEEYEEWAKNHRESGACNANYSGSSPAMETEAAVRLWKRSIKETGFRYASVLSDGDAKTLPHLQEVQPYGPDFEIKKEECLNHVSKRMYSGLKTIVDECKVKKITLGGAGQGQLTGKTMSKLSQYYRLAIERNISSVKDMKNGILATLYHCSSTDKDHNHTLCQKGKESWCFFQKAKALRQKPKSHTEMSLKLNKTVVKHILPLYKRLSEDQLLERCMRGGTQNTNECLHSVIWHKVPKEVFVSKSRLEIAVVHGIAEFNMGKRAAVQLKYQSRGEEVPAATANISMNRDQDRIRKSEEACSRFTRKRKREEKAQREKEAKKKEGTTYQAGGF